MLHIINRSNLKSKDVENEVLNTFQLLPKNVLKLVETVDLEIIYVNDLIKAIDRKSNGELYFVSHKHASGLFNSAKDLFHIGNKRLQIFICVDMNEYNTNYYRTSVLMHEIGHFIDYVIGKMYKKDVTCSYSVQSDLFLDLDELNCKLFEEKLTEYQDNLEYYTDSIQEQFAQLYSMKYMGRIPGEFSHYYIELDNEINQLVDESLRFLKKEKFLKPFKNFMKVIMFEKKLEKSLQL